MTPFELMDVVNELRKTQKTALYHHKTIYVIYFLHNQKRTQRYFPRRERCAQANSICFMRASESKTKFRK